LDQLNVSAFGQVSTRPTNPPQKPLLQPIVVQTEKPTSSQPTNVYESGDFFNAARNENRQLVAVNAVPRKTSFAVLADVAIPGNSGILVESLDGSVVLDSYSNFPFNPASNVTKPPPLMPC
jgi:hypothetical protein